MIQETELKERRHCPQCDLYKDVRSFYRNKKGEYKPFCRKCTMETGKKNYWEKHHASFSKVATPHKSSSRRRSADKTRQQFIDLMAQGMTVKEACAKIDRSLATYKQWRMEIPGFREQVDSVRSVHAGKNLPNEWVGDFGYFRKVYFGFETFPHQQALVSALENTEPQHITLCLLPPEHGKMLPLKTLVPTPEGWTTMGELVPGSRLFDEKGHICRVVSVTPVHRRQGIQLTFSDQSTMDACVEHRWLTKTRNSKRTVRNEENGWYESSVKNTQEIADTLLTGDGRPNHALPVAEPLDLPEVDLPMDPYLLGVWLGDGHTKAGRITTTDPEIINAFELAGFTVKPVNKCTYGIDGLQTLLKKMDVFGWKHIPRRYFRSSIKQRLALLQGLMDTDGSCSKSAQCEYTTTLSWLADDVEELIRTLGFKVRRYGGRATLNGKDCGPKFRLSFYPREPVFRLRRKAERQLTAETRGDRDRWLTILKTEPIGEIEGVCIQVDSPSHLFLAGKQMIPTHNSTTIEDWVCRKLALDPNHRFGIVSEGTNQARKMVRRIQRRMNPPRTTDYTAKYGPFYDDGQEREGKPWTADYFTVAKADHDERDASVSAVGSTSAIYGARIDTLIVDDIQSRRSINRTEELLRTFRQDFLSRVGKTGRTIIIGTRVGIGDFYERLIEEDLPHKIIILPAFNEDGEALCPDLWNQEQLTEKRRQVGEEVWECAYQQTPAANQLSTFTEDMIELSLDEDRGIGMIRPGDFTVVGLDPALGGGNAVTAFSFGVDKLNLLDCEKLYNLARVEDILARVEEFAIRYKPRQVVVERDAFQKGLAADERLRLLGKRYGFDIIAHTTSRNKSDEVMGVASMAGSFMRGEFRIPYKDELTRLRVQPLLKELRNWRPNVSGKLLEQDLTMSCWFVWRTWLQMRQSINAKPAFLQRPSWAKGQWRHRVA